MVQTHQQALDMKQKLELSIAMLEQADNKPTKSHDQDIANRIIDSLRAGLRNAAFQNIAERNELASVLQTFKTSRDNGEIIDLELLLSDIVDVFSRSEEEPEPTLQAAMLANTTRVEHQDQRGPPGAGGASSSKPAQQYKRRYEDDKLSAAQDPNVIEKILKTLYDLKSDMGFIKKHISSEPKQTETQAPKRFGNKGTESNKRTANFAGVARETTTFTPRSLVDRPLTTIDDNDSEQTAFMTMSVPKQHTAKDYFRSMTSHNNSNVLGDLCIRHAVLESHGAGYGYPTADPIHIPDTIPKMYSPESSVPIDKLSPHLSRRVADTIMISLMKEQQDMEDRPDDKMGPNIPSILSTLPHCIDHAEDLRSPLTMAIRIVPQAQPTSPSFSPSAPQVEPFDPEIEIPARDNVKRPLPFSEPGVVDMRADKPGPYTRSSARADNRIIPESVPLSDSEDEVFAARQVRLVSYGASASPAVSTRYQQASAVLAPTIENVPPPSSYARIEHLRSSSDMPPSGTQIRFKLSTKANRITVPRPYGPKNIDDDLPDLVPSSSDEGDM